MRTWTLRVVRGLLWTALVLLAVRAVATLVWPAPRETVAAPAPPAPPAVDTEGARLFAVLFTREYLAFTPATIPRRPAVLKAFLAPHLDGHGGLVATDPRVPQRVIDAWAWHLKPLRDDRALVTVVAEVATAGADGVEQPPRRMALAVPVALAGDGFVVYDYPVFVPLPAPGTWTGAVYGGEPQPDLVPPVRELVQGFLRAYAEGSAAELRYFLVPGTEMTGLGGQFRFRELTEVEVLKTGDEYWAVAQAVLEDPVGGVGFRQRYLFRIARHERWYVQDIQQKGEWTR